MGPMDDTAANAIRACDPNGALMMYVSRMVPTCEKSCFYAFGPVFIGTIATGQKVRIQGLANQSAWCSWWARPPVRIAHVPSGNPVALVGVDQLLLKSGTLTSIDDARNIADMTYNVSLVVKVAVKPMDGRDLPRLVEGLKKLSKWDPLVVCTTEESRVHVIAGCGQLCMESCLRGELWEGFARSLRSVRLHCGRSGGVLPRDRRGHVKPDMSHQVAQQTQSYLIRRRIMKWSLVGKRSRRTKFGAMALSMRAPI